MRAGPPRGEASGAGLGLLQTPSSPPRPPFHTGQYVFRPCSVNHTAGECRVCESGTFLAFPNGEPTCQRCIQCRKGKWAQRGLGLSARPVGLAPRELLQVNTYFYQDRVCVCVCVCG